jgi:hypothetical protein
MDPLSSVHKQYYMKSIREILLDQFHDYDLQQGDEWHQIYHGVFLALHI